MQNGNILLVLSGPPCFPVYQKKMECELHKYATAPPVQSIDHFFYCPIQF